MYGRNIGTDTIGYALSQEYKFTRPGAALDERRPGKAKKLRRDEMKIHYKGVCIEQVYDKGVEFGTDPQAPWYERKGAWKWAPNGIVDGPMSSSSIEQVKRNIDSL